MQYANTLLKESKVKSFSSMPEEKKNGFVNCNNDNLSIYLHPWVVFSGGIYLSALLDKSINNSYVVAKSCSILVVESCTNSV